jgi:PAS domain-containing protein
MDFIKQYLDIIIASITILGILFRVFVVLRKYCMNISDMKAKISFIHSELTPNHGSSIKDKINRIEDRIACQNSTIDKISHRQIWLLDNESVPLFETDIDGKFTWVNKKFKDLVHRDDKYLLGYGWKNIIHDRDRDAVIDKFMKCITDQITYEDSFEIVDDHENTYNVHCLATAADDGEYMGVIRISSGMSNLD